MGSRPLRDGELTLRALRGSDRAAWSALRIRNHHWLQEWDATLPQPDSSVPSTFARMVRHLRREARAGRAWSFGIFANGVLVGQVTLGGVMLGSMRSASIGYWIDQDHAGRGLMPRAVALVCDFAFFELGLHRLEINLRPENRASRRVAEKLGFTAEGLRSKYMHINGDWRDHDCYVLLDGDLPGGVLAHYRASTV